MFKTSLIFLLQKQNVAFLHSSKKSYKPQFQMHHWSKNNSWINYLKAYCEQTSASVKPSYLQSNLMVTATNILSRWQICCPHRQQSIFFWHCTSSLLCQSGLTMKSSSRDLLVQHRHLLQAVMFIIGLRKLRSCLDLMT